MPEQPYLTAALYQFIDLPEFADWREPLQTLCDERSVKGLLLLAPEGVNGTIAGLPEDVQAVLDWLKRDPRLAALEHKEARAARNPFYRMRVRLKREIVTLGVPALNPARNAGEYVKPEDWNALISDPDVVVVDTRNDYEVGIGSFAHAVNPHTQSFTEFPQWVAEQSGPGGALHGKQKVAMFCTGGIRCEKSTAYLKSQGFGEVYHLQGGILKYLETVPQEDSLWWGECFVFDERVSVGHGLVRGPHQLCRSCRMPLGEPERQHPHYVRGVSCPYCHGSRTPEQLTALAERQRQMDLAGQRGEAHLGHTLTSSHQSRREQQAQQLQAMQGLPILYSFRRCPYAIRARLALAGAGIACQLREVVLKNKPQALLAASPKGTVPVLVLADGTVIDQSLDIMLWALRQSDPDGWLAPTAGSPEAMLALIARNDGEFKQALDRCKYPDRHLQADLAQAQATADAFLSALNEQLAATGYLFGKDPSLADMAIRPFVRQFAGIDDEAWQARPWPHLQAWLTRLTDSALFEQVMDKYPAWHEDEAGVPFPPEAV
ncbi:MAG: rhodanese-related sulfurtransferase [Comamonas sp.]